MTLGLQHNPLMTNLYTPMSLALQTHWKAHNNAYRSSAQVPPRQCEGPSRRPWSTPMKRIHLAGALLALSCFSVGVHAEGNCPPGFYPIGGRATAACAPIPGNGGRSSGGQQQAPSAPAPLWEDRWGAIAGDKPQGILGFSTGLPSEPAAQQAALADCAAKGGEHCKIENSYRNGCTAMIVGEWGYNIASRATVDEAIASGIQKCKEVDRNCVAS